LTLSFLIDEGLPRRAAEALRGRGVEAWHVTELGLRSASDLRIMEEAVRRGALIVCYDSDFHRHLAESGASSPSVMRLRVELGHECDSGLGVGGGGIGRRDAA